MPTTESTLADFVKERVAELGQQKSRKQISQAAGYENQGTLTAIEDGRIKLPLDRAVPLADALGADRRSFLLLALAQYLDPDLIKLVAQDPAIERMRAEYRATLVATQVELVIIRDRAENTLKSLANSLA